MSQITKLEYARSYEGPAFTDLLWDELEKALRKKKLPGSEVFITGVKIEGLWLSAITIVDRTKEVRDSRDSSQMVHPDKEVAVGIQVYPLSGQQAAMVEECPVDRNLDWWGCEADLVVLRMAPQGLF